MEEKKKTVRKTAGKVTAVKRDDGHGANLRKLALLFTIVDRKKGELYADLIGTHEVNMQLLLAAHGTAPTEILNLLGLVENEKTVIVSVIPTDKKRVILEMLEEKFRTVRGGKGIAYTVPLSSTVGVAIYQFLSNRK